MKALVFSLLVALASSSGVAQMPLSLDTSFRCTRFMNNGLLAILPLEDGSILASGSGVRVDGILNPPYSFFRILSNGHLDDSWTTVPGYGDILAFGDYYYLTFDGFPLRYFRTTGERDQGFNPILENYLHAGLLHGNGGDVYVQADGMVLCTGDHRLGEQWGINSPGRYSLLRVDTNGMLDSTFQYRKTDGVIWTLEPTTQGRFLVSGVYNTYEGLPEGRILRIWPDGSLDDTFHTEIIKGYAACLVEQPNGRILAGGQFVFSNEPDTMHLIRLMPDGALDTTFNNHGEYKQLPELFFGDFAFGVHDVLPLEDGRLLVGGSFTHLDGQLRRGIALLDSTGHLLGTALTGGGCGLWHDHNSTFMYSQVNAIGQATDGSIYLAGFFKGFDDGTVSDTNITFIAKLNSLSVGMAEVQMPKHTLRVWPNPGEGHVRLSWLGQVQFSVEVIDTKGRMVLQQQATYAPFDLDLSHLPSGLYNLLVTAPDGTKTTAKWMYQ